MGQPPSPLAGGGGPTPLQFQVFFSLDKQKYQTKAEFICPMGATGGSCDKCHARLKAPAGGVLQNKLQNLLEQPAYKYADEALLSGDGSA